MKVLALGSHCDDIELGCGGTLHKHKLDWQVTCAVFMRHADHVFHENIWESSVSALAELGSFNSHYFDLSVNKHSDRRQEIWEILHRFDVEIQPDLVFTQYSDENQDHAVLYLETLRNFRKSSVLAYRSSIRNCLSFDGSAFEPLGWENVEAKLKALSHYPESYRSRIYFKPENVVAVLRTQAIYIEAEFAECFSVVKKVGV